MHLPKGVLLLVLVMVMLIVLSSALLAQVTYTVQRGDTLWNLAQRYNTTIAEIRRVNNYWSTYIYPGQVLKIPSTGKTHVVRRGESLWSIANTYGISLQALRNANNIWTNMITPGQVLVIPEGSTSPGGGGVYTRATVTQYEMDLMARTVFSEARGEPYVGQVAVAAVILNRLHSSQFPNSIYGVIFQPLAFSPVADGSFWLTPNQTAYNAVLDALRGWDPSHGALYFYNPVTATSRWIFTRRTITRIGRHVFAI